MRADWLAYVTRIENQKDDRPLLSTPGLPVALQQAAKRLKLQASPERGVRRGRADEHEDIALRQRLLHPLGDMLPCAELLSVEPVVNAPGVQRRQEGRHAGVILVDVTDEDSLVARHRVLPVFSRSSPQARSVYRCLLISPRGVLRAEHVEQVIATEAEAGDTTPDRDI